MLRSAGAAALVFLTLLLGGCDRVTDRPAYPFAHRLSHVDMVHDTSVPDPYRWLERDAADSAEDIAAVSAWLMAQQSLTADYFAGVPSVSAVRDSLARLWQFERREAPRRFGERWFLFRNTNSADHYAFALQSDPTAEPVTLLDPGEWSNPQLLLAAVSISPDGRFLAWLQTDAEGQVRLWHLRDLNAFLTAGPNADPIDFDVALDWLDVDDIVWRSNSRGFYYSAVVPDSDPAATGIYFHEVQSGDAVPSTGEAEFVSGNVVRPLAEVDGRWLVVTEDNLADGAVNATRSLLLDLQSMDGPPLILGEGAPGTLRFLGSRDGKLFFLNASENSAGSVLSIDTTIRGAMSLTVDVAPEQRQILRALPVSDGVLVEYLQSGVSVLERVSPDGSRAPMILPGLGRIASLSAGEHEQEVFYSFSTLTAPEAVFRLNTATGVTTALFVPDLNFHPEDFVVERVNVPSAQAGSIPVLIAGRRDRVRAAGSNLLLEVYGGFGIPLHAGFSIARLGWMDQGGVYAMAAVRGGGELGPHWHQQAIGIEKPRSIDDLLLAAEYLEREGYVERGRLAVMGGSHGAMLAAAAMNKAPLQFAAAVLSSGPMDMLRHAELGGAMSWRDEYGSVENAEQFAALLSYSPYHNVRSGTDYPAVLLLTSQDDEVVAPAHSYKLAARLQAEVNPSRPVLLRTRLGGGHLDTGTVSQLLDQYSERWAFLLHELER